MNQNLSDSSVQPHAEKARYENFALGRRCRRRERAPSPTTHAAALDAAKAAFASLPGLRLITATGMRIEVDGPGFVARGLARNLEANVWKGDAGCNGAIRLTQPNQFALKGVDALGQLWTTSLVLVMTSQADVLRDN